MSEQFPIRKGEFVLIRKIGEGGMAEVFLAERGGDEGFKTLVALKRLHGGFALDQYFIRQLVQEAKLLGQLQHNHIVGVHDLRKIDDDYYIVMEYVDGIDLAQAIHVHRENDLRFPLSIFFHIALALCEALDFAHSATDMDGKPIRLIHRDIKPSNVLISRRGIVKLTDFGIARVGDTSNTGSVVKGTANYMSPEQASGEQSLTPASDIFSLGAVFWEMLTLEKLVDGSNYLNVINSIKELNVGLKDITKKGIEPGLRMILLRMLARKRELRYQNMGLVQKDLRFVAEQMKVDLSPSHLREYMAKITQLAREAAARMHAGSNLALAVSAEAPSVGRDAPPGPPSHNKLAAAAPPAAPAPAVVPAAPGPGPAEPAFAQSVARLKALVQSGTPANGMAAVPDAAVPASPISAAAAAPPSAVALKAEQQLAPAARPAERRPRAGTVPSAVPPPSIQGQPPTRSPAPNGPRTGPPTLPQNAPRAAAATGIGPRGTRPATNAPAAAPPAPIAPPVPKPTGPRTAPPAPPIPRAAPAAPPRPTGTAPAAHVEPPAASQSALPPMGGKPAPPAAQSSHATMPPSSRASMAALSPARSGSVRPPAGVAAPPPAAPPEPSYDDDYYDEDDEDYYAATRRANLLVIGVGAVAALLVLAVIGVLLLSPAPEPVAELALAPEPTAEPAPEPTAEPELVQADELPLVEPETGDPQPEDSWSEPAGTPPPRVVERREAPPTRRDDSWADGGRRDTRSERTTRDSGRVAINSSQRSRPAATPRPTPRSTPEPERGYVEPTRQDDPEDDWVPEPTRQDSDLRSPFEDDEPVAAAGGAVDGTRIASLSDKARRGGLGSDELADLRGVGSSDPLFNDSRAVLLAQYDAAGDRRGHCEVATEVMQVGGNGANPQFNLEMGKCHLRQGRYRDALDSARTAELNAQDIPQRVRTDRQLKIWEVQAKAYKGLYQSSENLDYIDDSIAVWKRFSHLARNTYRQREAEKADQAIRSLQDLRDGAL